MTTDYQRNALAFWVGLLLVALPVLAVPVLGLHWPQPILLVVGVLAVRHAAVAEREAARR